MSFAEPLEPRKMMAVFQWDGGESGNGQDFLDPVNWVGDVLPGAADTAIIAATGANPTILLSGTTSVAQIQTSRSIELRGGTLQNATVTATGGAKLIATDFGGMLDNATVSADIAVGSTGFVTVVNGLTLHGTATLGANAHLDFAGTQTLGGTGTVVFSRFYDLYVANALQAVTDGMTLTIGAGITIRGGSGVGDYYMGDYDPDMMGYGNAWIGARNPGFVDRYGLYGPVATNVSVVNQGTIVADVSDGSLGIYPTGSGTFVNTGTIKSTGGSRMFVPAFTNTGTVMPANGGTIFVRGAYAQTAGTLALSGGTFDPTGTVTISGGTVGGTGTIKADVTNAGTALPGGADALGTLRIEGSYTQTSAGTLGVDIGGATRRTWSLADDFSTTTNPLGPWAYGWQSPDGRFTPFPTLAADGMGSGRPMWWAPDREYFEPGGDLSVWKNDSSAVNGVPPGAVSVRTGPYSAPAIVRWTAPVAGSVTIAGAFGTDSIWYLSGSILHNGTAISSGIGYGNTSFSFTRTVAVGDTIDWLVSTPYASGETTLDITVTAALPAGTTVPAADRLAVTGTAALGGTLALAMAGGYQVPASDVEFRVLTAGARSGVFASTSGQAQPNGRSFTTAYGSAGVRMISAVNDTTPPQVVSITPAGLRNQDVSTFRVQFDEPIAAASFTAADVAVVTPTGTVATNLVTVTAVSATAFDVSVPTLSTDGDYSITIGPAVTDTAGNPMAAASGSSVTIDKTGPRVTAVAPSGTAVAPLSTFDVTFSTPIDAATLTAADVGLVRGPLPGTRIAPTSIAAISSTVYRLTFPTQTLPGTYTLSLGPDVRDAAGNAMDQDADGTNGEAGQDVFTAVLDLQAVDLTVTDLVVAEPTLESGGTVTIRWSDTNAGNGAASGSWRDRVRVVNTTTGQTLVDALVAAAGPVAAGASLAREYSFRLPDGTAGVGTFAITVTADAEGQVSEANAAGTGETNNAAVLERTAVLAPYPGLSLASIATPAEATAGRPLTISWTVANVGDAAATGAWNDEVYLSLDDAVGNDIYLAGFRYESNAVPVGGSVTRTETVQIPAWVSGSGRIVVRTDVGNRVFEMNEADNVAIAALVSLLPGLTFTIAAATVTEGGGGQTAVLTRSGSTVGDVVVGLSANAPGLTFPAQVTIPDGQSSVAVTISAVNDTLAQGSRTIGLTAAATGYASGSDDLSIIDDDLPTLALTAATTSPSEAAGPVVLTVTRNSSTALPVTVTVVTDSTSRMTVPTTVTIPAGTPSATFTVTPVNNTFVEGNRTARVSVAAAGFGASFVDFLIVEDDVPTISLTIAADVISEAAGPIATWGTITRTDVTDSPVMVGLRGTLTDLIVPTTVTILAGEASARFLIGAVNNSLADGNRTATIQPSVVDPVSRLPLGSPAPARSLLVTDDDGPTLTLAVEPTVLAENGSSGVVTVTRNTPTAAPLVVAVTSGDLTEATVPATVTIPAGQASVTFPVTAVADGIQDGTQSVTILAEATGFNPGSVTLQVTDRDLANLQVTSVTLPEAVWSGGQLTIDWVVANTGLGAATGTWTDAVYLSPDAELSADDTLVGTFPRVRGLAPGESYANAVQVALAAGRVGRLYAFVMTDNAAAVPELLDADNTTASSAPVTVAAPYIATVATDFVAGPNPGTIRLTGFAQDLTRSGVFGMPNVPVTIDILTRGTVRTLTATTGADGRYTADFKPLPGEAGHYAITSGHPSLLTRAEQDSFDILGLTAADKISASIVAGTSTSGSITLTNRSALPLTGLAVDPLTLPSGVTLLTTLRSATVAGDANVVLDWTLSAAANVARLSGNTWVVVHSAEGVVVNVPLSLAVAPLAASLAVTPGQLSAGMLRGRDTLVSFDVVNAGGVDSGPLTVMLPESPWLSLATQSPAPSVAAGGRTTVTLRLSPNESLDLGPYDGSLTLLARNTQLTVPFRFRAVSEATGSVSVTVIDEYTYFADGAPNLAGARVTLTDPYTAAVVAEGTTDAAGGIAFAGVPEGTYVLEVNAVKHDNYRGAVTVTPGGDTEQKVFLPRQVVSYQWRVVPTAIEDNYSIALEPVFEADVPMPVVTIVNPVITPIVVPGYETQFPIIIRNQGLIDATKVRIRVPDDPDFIITPLISYVDRLAAKSELMIPVTIAVRESSAMLAAARLNSLGMSATAKGSLLPTSFSDTDKVAKCLNIGLSYTVQCGQGRIVEQPVTVQAVLDVAKCLEKILQKLVADQKILGEFLRQYLLELWMQLPIDVSNLATSSGVAGVPFVSPLTAPTSQAVSLGVSADPSEMIRVPGGGLSQTYRGRKIACDVVDAFLSCFPGLSPCLKAGIKVGCGTFVKLVGKPWGALGGSFAESVLDNWKDVAACLCDIAKKLKDVIPEIDLEPPKIPFPVIHVPDWWQTEPAGGGSKNDISEPTGFGPPPGDGGGGGFFLKIPTFSFPVPLIDCKIVAVESAGDEVSFKDPRGLLGGRGEIVPTAAKSTKGVCAEVRLRLDQQVVITRTAFAGTLDIVNGLATGLDGVEVTLDIRDADGQSASDRFAVRGPQLKGLAVSASGLGAVAGNTTGTVSYTFVPTNAAAPNEATVYKIGGTLSYLDNGTRITVPLAPVGITVYPEAQLNVDYFWQRDVYADDPFTPAVEPSEPFAVGLQVTNVGKGTAANMRITSAQPKIVENEKGLAIDYTILSSQVGAQPGGPSLTVNLGTIAPGQTRTAQWNMVSPLQGKFLDYSANFRHLDDRGDARTSLIRNVRVHELVRAVQVDVPSSDSIPDYLVNDLPDAENLPDTLYMSTGGQAPVKAGRDVQWGPGGGLTRTISARVDAGWSYLRATDPLPRQTGYVLVGAVAEDGTAVPAGMLWQTDRTFRSSDTFATRENLLHLLDYNADANGDGVATWTLTYRLDDTVAPSITGIEDLSASVRAGAVDRIDVTFSEPVNAATFGADDVTLLRNGVAVAVSGLSFTIASGNTYRVGGLAAFTGAEGNYEFRIDGAGLTDLAGNAGTNAATTSWATSTGSPVVVNLTRPASPGRQAVDAVDVTFSEAMDAATLGREDLSLSRDGVAVALDDTVTVVPLDATTFRVSGLAAFTGSDGRYVLAAAATGTADAAGTSGVGVLGVAWTMDATAPTVVGVEHLATNPRNTVVRELDVEFSEPIDPASFDRSDITLTRNGSPNLVTTDVTVTRKSATVWTVSGFNWVVGQSGTYVLTVHGAGIRDLAGNAGVGSAAETWVMDTVKPTAATNLRIADAPAGAVAGRSNSLWFRLEGDLPESGLAVRIQDRSSGADIGYATVTGTTFSRLIGVPGAGQRNLLVRTIDAAGNFSDVTFGAFIDVTAPGISGLEQVSQSPRTAPVERLDVVFEEAIVGFGREDLRLTRNGATVALDDAVAVTLVSGNTYRISGLTGFTTTPGDYALTVDAAGVTDLFGNVGTMVGTVNWTTVASLPTGIRGLAYVDTDGDGVRDTGESAVTGRVVFLDTDGNGVLDAGETSVVTAADGTYAFENLPAGTYRVTPQLPAGWISTQPADGFLSVSLAEGQTLSGRNLGSFQTGTIGGVAFSDLDADGIRDAGEPVAAGWTVFLDADRDGVLGAGERSVVTGSDGRWEFTGVGPGTTGVGAVVPAGWTRTTVNRPLNVVSGFATDTTIGHVQLGTIRGVKFNDYNGNGTRDAGEPGVGGWIIFLDGDADGVRDADETWVTTAADGSFVFADLLPGNYTVAEVQVAGWRQTSAGTAGPAGTGVSTTSSGVELLSLGCSCGGSWAVNTTTALVDYGAVAMSSALAVTGVTSARADARFQGLDGHGVRTVIIDTGIDAGHPFFGPDRNNDGIADRIVFQYDFADMDADARDTLGHGSHIAGVLGSQDARYAGVAPGADLIALKVFSDSGRGTFAALERALQWVIANWQTYDIGVVNMSLGDGGNWSDDFSRYGIGDELAAIARLPIVSVAAAGNDYLRYGRPGVAYPASDPAVLAVGATWAADFGGPWKVATGAIDYATGVDRIAAYSQRDTRLVDTFAPGSRFNGAAPNGGVKTMQGTSQAAGFLSGIAALAQQVAGQYLGRRLTTGEFAGLLDRTGDWIVDGDDEIDNVVNTGASFQRVNFARIAAAIVAGQTSAGDVGGAGPGAGDAVLQRAEAGVHSVSLAAGGSLTADFGNQQIPVVESTGAFTGRTATYGTASAATSVSIAGSYLTGDLVATAPAGFEVSVDDVTYAPTATLSRTGRSATGTLFVRLSASAGAGTWSGDVSLSTNGTSAVTVAVPSSTVSPKTLTVTAAARTKTYGDVDPALTFAVSGLVGSDAVSGSLARAAGQSVGTYAITQGTLAAGGNYAISFAGSSLTIAPKAITVSGLTIANKVYDGTTAATISGTVAYSGLVSGESFAVTGTPTAAFADANAGTGKAVTVSGYTAPTANYTVTQPAGLTANVTPKTLTVTANNISRVYGSGNPDFRAVLTGFVNGETAATALTGQTFMTTTATAASPVGKYPITPAVGTLEAINGNYSFVFAAGGLLTVNKAPLTVVIDNKTKVAGQPDPAFTFSMQGLVNGDTAGSVLTGTAARSAGEAEGAYAISRGTLALQNSAAAGNYNAPTVTPGTLRILLAAKPLFVRGVFVRGGGWADNYLGLSSFITAAGGTRLGFALGDGTSQLAVSRLVTWTNVNRVSVRFSEPIANPGAASLSLLAVTGAGAGTQAAVTSTAVALSEGGTVATWTVPSLTTGRYTLVLRASDIRSVATGGQLDGEWATASASSTFTNGSGDGIAGGDFRYRFNVLVGDINASGSVLITDLTLVETALYSPPTATTFRYDINGTGMILLTDANEVSNALAAGPANLTAMGEFAPVATAAAGATVDAAFDLTFADNATWRNAITGISAGATAATATPLAAAAWDRTVAGRIRLDPALAAQLQTAGSRLIVITAAGFADVRVTQSLAVGAAAKLGITTQPVGPATNGGVLLTQPVVRIQDRYGNTVTTSTALVMAALESGTGSWTLGGTLSRNAVAGVATFSGLTATSSGGPVSGAKIRFTAGSLTLVVSAVFAVP